MRSNIAIRADFLAGGFLGRVGLDGSRRKSSSCSATAAGEWALSCGNGRFD
jgi:hypothetical protein